MSVPFYMKKQDHSNAPSRDTSKLDIKADEKSIQAYPILNQANMFRSDQFQQRMKSMEISGLPVKSQKSFDWNDSAMFNSNVTIAKEHIISFDHVLQDIGFGRYQIWIYMIMGLNGVTEGSQVTIFTLMQPILKHEWNVSNTLNSLQASFVFIGFLIGSMIAGQFSDRWGRRRPFLYSSFLTMVFSFSSILCQNIYTLLLTRGLMGILVGFFAPCGVTMLSEITPVDLRGRYMGLITLTFALGQLFGLFVASFTLSSLNSGNWRALTFWCTVPGAFGWLICYLKMKESPRFELLQKNFDQSFKIMEQMNQINQGSAVIDEITRFKLQNWAHAQNKIAKNQHNASVMSLFADGRWKVSTLIWFNWFSLSFMYYGIVLLLPYLLSQIHENHSFLGQDKLLQLVVSCISDIVGACVASYLIELKGFGRKNSLIIFFAFQAFTSLLVYCDSEERFILWATASKFFLSMTFIFSFQYTAEIYPTKIRTTGVGMANGVGRIGGVIMPWICYYMADRNLLSPFLLFTILSILTSISNVALPFDTMGKELDG